MKPDGSWTYEVPYPNPTGIRVFDEFRAEPTTDGTMLLIHSTLTAEEPSATDGIARLKEWMIQGWNDAAKICERDAP